MMSLVLTKHTPPESTGRSKLSPRMADTGAEELGGEAVEALLREAGAEPWPAALGAALLLGLFGLALLVYSLWARSRRPLWAAWYTRARCARSCAVQRMISIACGRIGDRS